MGKTVKGKVAPSKRRTDVALSISAHTYRQLPADHPAYALIGRIAAEWAQLEHTLDTIIWELAGLESEVGSCITAQMIGHGPRFQAVMALAARHRLDGALIKDAYEEMNRTSNVARKYRNRYVHDAWYVETSTENLSQFKSFRWDEKAFGFHNIDADDVNETIEKIVKRTEKVRALKERFSEKLKALREKSS